MTPSKPGQGGEAVPPWLLEAIRALVRAQVKRMAGYFAHYRDIGEEDQAQHATMRVLDALGGYDTRRAPIEGAGPDRVSKPFSTYVTMVAKRRLIDLHRTRSRQAAQDVAIAICADAATRDAEHGEPAELGDEELVAWVRTIRVAADRHARTPDRRARRTYTPGQAVAVAALMWRQNLSPRGALLVLAESPDLLAALALGEPPSLRTLARAAADGTRFPEKRATANNGGRRRTTAGVEALLPLVELHRRTAMHNLAEGAMRDLPVLLTFEMIRDRVLPVSVSTLDKLIASGRFPRPCKRVGRLRMWAREHVVEWLKQPDPRPAGRITERAKAS